MSAVQPTRFTTAALPPADEGSRLAELRECGILDTEPEAEFDRLVELATVMCGAPYAALTFVDGTRQWYKARAGLPVPQVARDQSFCAHAILESDRVLEIPDVASLGWAEPQPWGPQGPLLRFYAGMPLRTRDGSAIGTLCVMDQVPRRLTDVQRQALANLGRTAASLLVQRKQLRAARQTDRLTGLPNWLQFEAEFEHTQPASGVVCFVRLKTINQIGASQGLRVADALVNQAADRLRAFGERGAFVGRLKRGVFILFFPQARPDVFAQQVAPELASALGQPYVVDKQSLVCPVNLGFASFPEDGQTLDAVVDAADAALQLAIEREQSTAFFDRSVESAQGLHKQLEPRLLRALENDEFVNYYQPKVELATGRIVGVEALVRWMDPKRGLVPPAEFLPALEATGLIGDVARKIIERAIADWRSWRDAGLPAPRIAVNVAAAQLRDEDFVPGLRKAMAVLKGNTSAIGLEVAESILISHMDRAIEVLQQVRSLGVPVAVDDFGTGYSSLSYIAKLPVDEIKIDRAFVSRITTDPAYEAIVRTCVSLAHGLNLSVVAEGVETDEQAAALRALGCNVAQGFLYSQPVPAFQLVKMLRAGPLGE